MDFLLLFLRGFFLYISLRFRFVVISLRAYKGINLKQTIVTDYVMTGSTGHLNLLGWCDCNIFLHVFIWVVLRSYGGDWREGGGFTLEDVVGMEGSGIGLSKGRGFE